MTAALLVVALLMVALLGMCVAGIALVDVVVIEVKPRRDSPITNSAPRSTCAARAESGVE